jgi:hypothetical protein
MKRNAKRFLPLCIEIMLNLYGWRLPNLYEPFCSVQLEEQSWKFLTKIIQAVYFCTAKTSKFP